MIIKKKPLIISLLASASIVNANADNELIEEVSVIAHRTPVKISELGVSVSIIDEAELKKIGGTSVADILRSVPGVNMSNNGGVGKQTSVRMRGEESYRTKVLVDGIDISDASSTQIQPRMAHLLNSQVSRIEVLRGPQGVIYGADAAGIINVSSKTTKEAIEADADLEIATHSTKNVSGNIRGNRGIFNYSITGSHLRTEGFNARSDDETDEADGYENTTLHTKFGLDITDSLSLKLVLRDVSGENEFDKCFVSVDCESDVNQTAGKLSLFWGNEVTHHEISQQNVKGYNEDRTDRVKKHDTESEVNSYEYNGGYKFNNLLSLGWGAENKEERFQDEAVEEDEISIESLRYSKGVFAETRFSPIETLHLSAGIRFDDSDNFDAHKSYRLTSALQLPIGNNELKLRSAYSTGFRLPSLYEINRNKNVDITTVPDHLKAAFNKPLEEEFSRGYELGADFTSNNLNAELTFFKTKIENEIYFDLQSWTGYLQHDEKTESKGIELAADVSFGPVTVGGNYLYNKTKVNENTVSGAQKGDPRARRPEHTLNLFTEISITEAALIRLSYYQAKDAVDYVWEGSSAVKTELDNYNTFGLYTAFTPVETVEVYIRIDNITDSEYQLIKNFNTAGRTATAGIRLSF